MRRILITGTGRSGSWQIRGEQLGRAIGATVAPHATEFNGADLVVGVKRVPASTVEALRRERRPWVWDTVDAWPKEGNDWGKAQALEWLGGCIKNWAPAAIVFPTTAMRDDALRCGWVGPSLVLPHHAWPRYMHRVPVRKEVAAVGYEGGERYLGAWSKALKEECAARGWRFEANRDMTQVDIGVALREQTGWSVQRWKSNVKVANLQALGLPAVCSPEVSYMEFGSRAELYVETREQLTTRFDMLRDRALREELSERMAGAIIPLHQVAQDYAQWLNALNF